MNPLVFLIDSLFSLYTWVVLMRFLMHYTRADYYHPITQFCVNVTAPLVNPLRRVLPNLGKIETASLTLAFLLICLKILTLLSLAGINIGNPLEFLFASVRHLLIEVLNLLFFIIIASALLSWFADPAHPVYALLHTLSRPIMAPIQRLVPPISGIDISPVIALLLLQVVRIMLSG